jgi:hypothetical protein
VNMVNSCLAYEYRTGLVYYRGAMLPLVCWSGSRTRRIRP